MRRRTGGPTLIRPIIGIFAAIFGISVVYEALLLARTRERFVEKQPRPEVRPVNRPAQRGQS